MRCLYFWVVLPQMPNQLFHQFHLFLSKRMRFYVSLNFLRVIFELKLPKVYFPMWHMFIFNWLCKLFVRSDLFFEMYFELSWLDVFGDKFKQMHIMPGKLFNLFRATNLLSILQGWILFVLRGSYVLGCMSFKFLWRKYNKVLFGVPFSMQQLH